MEISAVVILMTVYFSPVHTFFRMKHSYIYNTLILYKKNTLFLLFQCYFSGYTWFNRHLSLLASSEIDVCWPGSLKALLSKMYIKAVNLHLSGKPPLVRWAVTISAKVCLTKKMVPAKMVFEINGASILDESYILFGDTFDDLS